MRIEFTINVEREREPKMLEYLRLFARTLLLGEDETICDVKIDDVPVIDSNIEIY